MGRRVVCVAVVAACWMPAMRLPRVNPVDVLRASETTASTRSIGSADWILRFSLPVLEHIERYQDASDSPVDAQKLAIVHEHLEKVLVELIADDLKRVG
jgi:hypothetical protein